MAKTPMSRTVEMDAEAHDALQLVVTFVSQIDWQRSTIVLKRGQRTTTWRSALRRRLRQEQTPRRRAAHPRG